MKLPLWWRYFPELFTIHHTLAPQNSNFPRVASCPIYILDMKIQEDHVDSKVTLMDTDFFKPYKKITWTDMGLICGTYRMLRARIILVKCLPVLGFPADISDCDASLWPPSPPLEKWKKDKDAETIASFDGFNNSSPLK